MAITPLDKEYVWDKKGCEDAVNYFDYEYGCQSEYAYSFNEDGTCFVKMRAVVRAKGERLKRLLRLRCRK